MRIRVAEFPGTTDRITLTHPAGALMVGVGARTQRLSTPVTLWSEGGAILAQGARSKSIQRWSGATEVAVQAPSGAAREITWNKSRWPGEMMVVRPDAAKPQLDLVVHVGLETYLPGVLARELYPDWDEAAFRAQAVAARSFAVCEHEFWKTRRHYDMVAGQASQAWIGATTHSRSRSAASATRGRLLVWGARVVPAYYSSCCGGRPADAIDCVTANPNFDIPPLQAHEERTEDCCESAPRRKWSQRIPVAEALEALHQYGREHARPDLAKLGKLRAIEVVRRNDCERPEVWRIRDTTGASAEITAEQLRWALADAAGPTPSSSDFTARLGGDTLLLEGRGFGHGAGMCQHGAQHMATGGSDWQQILERYYPGSVVQTAWK